ncbi:hypothetical protein ACIQU2_12440 [Pseudomonas sp. NPDC098740]|uniref:hypothetical protein n=1 Tax=Pseudomonas sp. NPDC098740 TaxID=3364486 RepID=UPI003839D91C
MPEVTQARGVSINVHGLHDVGPGHCPHIGKVAARLQSLGLGAQFIRADLWKAGCRVVDTFLTIDASQALLDWISASGKNLTTIYVTHGHADHFLV